MADISVRREHGLEPTQAKEKVRDIVTDLQNDIKYIDTVDWKDDGSAADIKGKGFRGEFRVDAEAVQVDIDLKLMAKPFKGTIAEKIESRMGEYFG